MYSLFAKYYDAFTENADYAARADYLSELIEKYGKGKGILLDLACGTGTLSFEMEKRGFDVIGTDISAEMLDEALEKKLQTDSHIIFLNQDMCELDLFGTITACICTLDSVNHIESARKLKAAFSKVSLFSEAGGVFIFDVNTEYKHRAVLGDNAYIYENDTCFLAWQNEVNEDASVNIYLDFFERNGILVPCLYVPLVKNAVNKITTAPTLEKSIAESSLKEFLEINGYQADVESSDIPVRF